MNDCKKDLVSASITYAARGWRVLPVKGKIPILKEWQKLATTDPETIRVWWSQWPDANVGIATGKESGLLVLDVDSAKGGDDTLRALEARYGALPDTIEVLTGGGGRHYYYLHPGSDIRNSAGRLGTGLDIRTEGGQVVAPPSIHLSTGRAYEWEASHHPEDTDLVPVPQWLLNQLTVKTEQIASLTSDATIPEGQRNNALARIAGKLRRDGLNEVELEGTLLAVNRGRCKPPLPDDEVRTIAASIARYPVDKAHSAQRPPTAELHRSAFAPVPAPQLLDEPEPMQTEWVWEDYLPQGGFGALIGKPKTGKTTNAYELAVKTAQGLPYLGRTTRRGTVLILAMEEHRREVKRRLRNLGADQIEEVHIHVGPLEDSPNTFQELKQYIAEHGIILVIFDALNTFWSVKEENDAVAVTAAIKPLLSLARESGAAVLLLHHARKSEGEHGDEIRGSGALFSLLDIALILKRHEVKNQRKLTAISRYPETPSELIIELREHGHEALGDPAAAGKAARTAKVCAALTDSPTPVLEIGKRAGVSRGAAYTILPQLVTQGLAQYIGTGKRGDPYLYFNGVSVSPFRSGGPNETGSSPDPNDHEASLPEVFVSFTPLTPRGELKRNAMKEDSIDSFRGAGGQTKRNEGEDEEGCHMPEQQFVEEVINDED